MIQSPTNIDPLNFLLTDVAQHIQLSATDYEKAQERYRAISEYLCANDSPIRQLNPFIYPQGSFRIQSTISSSDTEDRFDIDLMLELSIDANSPPDKVLDMVARALDRGKGSRYHGKIEKRRRCVTVQYDGMHLDITPAVLMDATTPRISSIFDTHPNRPNHVLANPEGFARWFDQRILPRQLLQERELLAREAATPVPDQKPLSDKPLRLLALQLLKRWRDRRADTHKIRKAPSVLLSKLMAEVRLVSEANLLAVLREATTAIRFKMNSQLHEVNPSCPPDVLTDRWPGEMQNRVLPVPQVKFGEDLDLLNSKLGRLTSEQDLASIKNALSEMFGERTTSSAILRLSEAMGKGSTAGTLGVLKGSGAVVLNSGTSAAARPVTKHSFFGSSDD